jgi:hypothetical protein
MTPAGIARVRACFENAEELFPAGDPRNKEKESPAAQTRYLPQLPQLPQQQAPARKVLTDREDAFEERAAIIEYDGGLPRSLAEFLAGRWHEQSGADGQ